MNEENDPSIHNIEQKVYPSALFFCIFELILEDTFARWEKYSSKLDISCSLIRIFEVNLLDTLARCKKIEVNFSFLARLFVSLR